MTEWLGPAWVDAIRLFLAFALGIVCLGLLWESIRRLRRDRTVAHQLESLSRAGSIRERSDVAPLFRPEEDEARGPGAVLLRYLPRREDLKIMLERADIDWGVGTFLLLTLGLAVAAGLGTSVVFVGPVGPLVAVIAGAALPYLYVRRRQKRRADAFEEHFPEAIELLARSLRAGHALLTGLEVVAEESPAPVDREFRQVYEQQRFGLPVKESMMGLVDRIDSVDVQMFVTSVLIQRESGGNLAEILDNLAALIRERFKFRRQLRVYTAQGRLTGYLLAVLPVAVGLALFAITSDYMIVLVEEPMGRLMLLVAVIMQIFGFLWIRKIVNVEF